MPRQNKHSATAADSRVTTLENELTGQIISHNSEFETGTVKVREGSAFQRDALRQSTHFGMTISGRRRHPLRTLNQHEAVWKTTEATERQWEAALMQDQLRERAPEIYQANPELGLLTSQVGLVATANKNFMMSRNKLHNTNLVGV